MLPTFCGNFCLENIYLFIFLAEKCHRLDGATKPIRSVYSPSCSLSSLIVLSCKGKSSFVYSRVNTMYTTEVGVPQKQNILCGKSSGLRDKQLNSTTVYIQQNSRANKHKLHHREYNLLQLHKGLSGII
jgi:hypothetical protein